MADKRLVAYFSMEIALDADIPTYSGGLGVLAGDTVRAAADRKVPLLAVTLLHRKGFFYQKLDQSGWQTEEPTKWIVEDFLTEMPARAVVTIEGRSVQLRAWKYEVSGYDGFIVPVFLLDTDLPKNSDWDRTLTSYLYGGDQHYRLCQEVILGIGGIKMLRALGYDQLQRYHMNEGHASLLTLALLDEHGQHAGRTTFTEDDIEAVREQCVFTTHTPVPAGHDQFAMDLVTRVLGRAEIEAMQEVFCCDGSLNMTYLAISLSHYVDGVAKKHGEVSRHMFAQYRIDAITNGVHAATWAAPSFQKLVDQYIPDWRADNFSLRYALSIPLQEVWDSHVQAKRQMIEYINHETNSRMDTNVLTLGFARRAATYKRADLLFHDIERLKAIALKTGKFQVV
jgi:starch phosphorylase